MLVLAMRFVMQVFNGHAVTAVEVSKAQAMFQALHEARTAASTHPLNELVGFMSVKVRKVEGFEGQYMHPAKHTIWLLSWFMTL